MERRDYFKKQIDQLALVLQKLLADLLALKQDKKTDEGIQLVSRIMKKELDLDLEFITAVAPQDLLPLLTADKKLGPEHLNNLADILYHMAESIHGTHEKEKSEVFYQKALALYEFLTTSDTTYSLDRYFKIENIKQILKQA